MCASGLGTWLPEGGAAQEPQVSGVVGGTAVVEARGRSWVRHLILASEGEGVCCSSAEPLSSVYMGNVFGDLASSAHFKLFLKTI